MKKQKVYVLIGPPASGKSTYAKKLLKKKNTKIISSDVIRILNGFELNQTAETFKIYYDNFKQYLKEGYNVILDSTNISLKHRHIIFDILETEFEDKFNSGQIEVIAIVVNTSRERCIQQLDARNKTNYFYKIPISAIDKYIAMFQMPLLSEGFSKRILVHKCTLKDKVRLRKNIKRAFKFIHNDKYHKNETYKEHIGIVLLNSNEFYTFMREKYKTNPYIIHKSILLHDYGKFLTSKQSEKDPEKNSYKNHANFGAWDYISHISTKKFINESVVIFIMNYHMYLSSGILSKKAKYYLKSEELYEMLRTFDIADKEPYEIQDN